MIIDRASFRNRKETNQRGKRKEERSERSGLMNGGERRRAEGFGCGVKDNPIINQIMLRFRPIAPKPDAGDSNSGVVPAGNKNLLLSVARKKRKYTRVRNRSEIKRTAKRSEKLRDDSVVTLQLLPERSESREALESLFLRDLNHAIISEIVPNWDPLGTLGSSEPATEGFAGIWAGDPSKTDLPARAVESSVTVERVTHTCMDAPSIGGTDVERFANLEMDTCPGFISNGQDEIQYINEAYRKLVGGGNERDSPVVITATLVTKEKLPYPYMSFTCRVTLQYTWQNHDNARTKTKTLTVPCDVWKMDRGGFAWRLDTNAALSLGL